MANGAVSDDAQRFKTKAPVWLWWYFLAVFIVCGGFYLVRTFVDPDLWGVMAFGALLDQNPGFFPYRDVFSYTAADQPWIYHEWGSGVVFYGLFKWLGSEGLLWGGLLLMGLILAVCWRCLQLSWLAAPSGPRAQAQLLLFSGFILLFLFLMPAHWMLLRCQWFTFLGYGLYLWILQRYRLETVGGLRQIASVLLGLPLIMLAWVNLHGGFVLGFFALGVFMLDQLWRGQWKRLIPLALAGLFCLGATLLNPYGLAFHQEMLSAWGLARTGVIEWANVLVASWYWGLVYSLLLLGFVVLAVRDWWGDRSRFPLALVFLLVTGVEGWLHFKLSAVFLLTALCLGFELPMPDLNALQRYPAWRDRLLGWSRMLPGAFALATVVTLFLWPVGRLRVPANDNPFPMAMAAVPVYPVGVVAYLQATQTTGNLWLPFDWGEFAFWNLFPRMKVSMDGRYETVYAQAAFEDNARFFTPPFDAARLDAYPQTTHLLLPAGHQSLIARFQLVPGWHLCYQDEVALLFARKPCTRQKTSFPNRTGDLNRFRGDLDRFRLSSSGR